MAGDGCDENAVVFEEPVRVEVWPAPVSASFVAAAAAAAATLSFCNFSASALDAASPAANTDGAIAAKHSNAIRVSAMSSLICTHSNSSGANSKGASRQRATSGITERSDARQRVHRCEYTESGWEEATAVAAAVKAADEEEDNT